MIDGAIMGAVGVWVSLVAYGKIADPTPQKRFQTPFWRISGPSLAAIGLVLALADALR